MKKGNKAEDFIWQMEGNLVLSSQHRFSKRPCLISH